ncbi:hypothetical protein L596_029249 [Steinernema carpocapsae]|uniref:Uncharacterized protein n=1 Tax=Steinernema carpocapsae TaxID=34508 RepID=A0A4U5LU38_STECR|nr:hypothetical protein L596_029249 [Steinernema carpocapsae]
MFAYVLVAALLVLSTVPKESEAMGGIMLFTPCSPGSDMSDCRMYKRAFMPMRVKERISCKQSEKSNQE